MFFRLVRLSDSAVRLLTRDYLTDSVETCTGLVPMDRRPALADITKCLMAHSLGLHNVTAVGPQWLDIVAANQRNLVKTGMRGYGRRGRKFRARPTRA